MNVDEATARARSFVDAFGPDDDITIHADHWRSARDSMIRALDELDAVKEEVRRLRAKLADAQPVATLYDDGYYKWAPTASQAFQHASLWKGFSLEVYTLEALK